MCTINSLSKSCDTAHYAMIKFLVSVEYIAILDLLLPLGRGSVWDKNGRTDGQSSRGKDSFFVISVWNLTHSFVEDSLLSSKSTLSQPFKRNRMSEVARIVV